MRFLKNLLFGIAGLLVLLMIASFFLSDKGDYMERSVLIDAPKETIFAQVNDLKNWSKWSPWNLKDSTMKVTYDKSSVGKGASYSWTSTASGDGTLAIAESVPGQSIQTKMDFGNMGGGTGTWKFEDAENGATKVTWGMEPHTASGFPFSMVGKFFLAFGDMETSVGPDFEQGLKNIKEIAEKAAPKLASSSLTVGGVEYMSIREKVKMDAVTDFYAKNFPLIATEIAKSGKTSTGMPRGLFYDWDPEKGVTDMAAAMPVSALPVLENGQAIKIDVGEMMQYGNTLAYDYYGDYEGSEAAHISINKWLAANGKEIVYPVIEEYANDPTTVTSPSEILTKIYYTIADK